ncbi:hypothetical protein D1BOALGB6SA_4010 [Olavius sp. associated proteobacterium Delta 1]|nr:hypothetical protein D1BOALGB6SA_4010 [Olavius sp. associated proteobacterium Delta 1]
MTKTAFFLYGLSGGFSTLNVEPPAQTWIRRECLYSGAHNG